MAEEEEGKEEEEKHESLPKLFYCLPNGGFNDICVETWYCVDYARRTGRALVWGYHNYIPQVPPYEPYFTLRPIENKLLLIDPTGAIVMEHIKYGGNIVEGTLLGDGKLQAVTTPFGVLSGVICWDMDYPATIQQTGQNDRADVFLI